MDQGKICFETHICSRSLAYFDQDSKSSSRPASPLSQDSQTKQDLAQVEKAGRASVENRKRAKEEREKREKEEQAAKEYRKNAQSKAAMFAAHKASDERRKKEDEK